jgi:PadR family transcriptional regulator PadR
MTMQTQMVLRQALIEPGREWYGLEMMQATGLPSGTVYPIIARLEQAGWIRSRWEEPGEHRDGGRPRRRYYRLTEDGAENARLRIAAHVLVRGQRACSPSCPRGAPGSGRSSP